MKRIATIDLGTNTFHLLIVEIQSDGKPYTLHYEKIAVKIGQGGISEGRLTQEAFERALAALHQFRHQLAAYGVSLENAYATATSAIRNAGNGTHLVAEIAQQTGIQVRIISGDQEAQYIYEGVKRAVPIGSEIALVMDIGGGSVEFIVCTGSKVFWKQSFEIGAQRLLDQFMTSDPISPQSVQRLFNFLETQLIPLANAVHQYAPTILIGASGAFETLCAIHAKRQQISFDPDNFIQTELPLEAFTHVYRELLEKNHTERLTIPGMVAMRADMIVVASILIQYVITACRITSIHVSAYALKEGLLYTVLQG